MVRYVVKFFLPFILITSCNHKQDEINISEVDLNIKLSRLDQVLFDNDTSMTAKVPILKKKYGDFFTQYTERVLNLGSINDPTLSSAYKGFVYDPDISSIAKKTSALYPNLDIEFKEIEDAFKRYSIIFPKKSIPNIVTIISGFNYKIIVTKTTIGIGLDMYLGGDNPYYSALRFPNYKKLTLERKFISSDAIKGWVSTEFSKSNDVNDLLNEIISAGKVLYLQDILLPNTPNYIKIDYTPEQLNWCEQNEMSIWGHFINEKILFSKIKADYYKYISDGPFTKGFSRTSPPKIGIWVGWQIVKSYMKNNSSITPLELMNNNNAQSILNASNYKPEK